MVEIFEETRLEEEDTQRGRYLTFTLDENVYGLPIVYVKEIIGMQPITRVPETPDFIRGIVNLRGKIVPLIDVRSPMGTGPVSSSSRRRGFWWASSWIGWMT